MAVMKTPHGRVIGLIPENGDQPKAQPEAAEKVQEKPAPVKKAGRTAKK